MFRHHLQRLRFTPPDYTEQRGEHHLLIWGDLPYWLVIDTELLALLNHLDGQRTLAQVVDAHPAWKPMQRDILAQAHVLQRAGILTGHAKAQALTAVPPVQNIAIENVALNLTRGCYLLCSSAMTGNIYGRCPE